MFVNNLVSDFGVDGSNLLPRARRKDKTMEEQICLSFVYPNGSMREMSWRLFSFLKAFIDQVTSDDPLCLLDLNLGSASINKVDVSRSQDIPVLIERGAFDIGLVGTDWIKERETKLPTLTTFALSRSTFQAARIVLAAPGTAGYRSVKDLRLNAVVATEYPVTARKYFSRNGRSDIEILLSYGETERKIGLGVADAVIDVVETGVSLRQNGLAIVDTVGISKMAIVANRESLADPTKSSAIRKFARIAGKSYRLMRLAEGKDSI